MNHVVFVAVVVRAPSRVTTCLRWRSWTVRWFWPCNVIPDRRCPRPRKSYA